LTGLNFYSAHFLFKDAVTIILFHLESNVKGLGSGGSEIQYQVDGAKEFIQLSTQGNYSSIFSFGEGMSDPSVWFALAKAETKKDKRQATYMQASLTGKTKSPDDLIAYGVKIKG
jgi:hypothetical protein